ncbi:LysR family transcriptional regulator [Salinisphaera aquimarina]|uniref:LysR substrate-binding domain-containing protein n=1 Tax=Salinisphaera aquimarina TaxID=2094031 RepID=A0ABV7ERI5_9GAMM
MKLQQLETFFWAAKLGSFGAAADRLHATQSAVSMRIRELERGLGVLLFDRSKRSVKLTDKGRELVDYASRMLDLEADIEYRIATPHALTGSLRLGVAEVVSTTWLPQLIQAIAQCYPGVRLEIDEALTADLMRELQDGQLELVLSPGHTPDMRARTQSLGHVQFAWVANPALGLGGREHTPESLAEMPIIGLKNASFHHAGIENWFRRANVRCRYLARCKSLAVAAAMATAGTGIAYVPVRCFQQEIAQGRLEVLATERQFPPVTFVAALAVDEFHPIATRVADLAATVSDFERD